MKFLGKGKGALAILGIVVLVLPLVLSCAAPEPTPTPVPTTAPAPAATPTKAPEATPTPKPAEKPQPTPTTAPAKPTPKPAATEAPPKPKAEEPRYGGTYRTFQLEDPPAWDPHGTTSYKSHAYVLSWIYSKLVKYPCGPEAGTAEYTPLGDLAESWENPDNTTYIFHLRKGVKFQNKPPVNGREFDADDVKFSFDRLLQTPTSARYQLDMLKDLEVVDEYTVKMTTKEPYAPFIHAVQSPIAGWIIPREVGEKNIDLGKWQNNVGTGPFMVDEYVSASKIVFKKNPDYYIKELPYVDAINVTVVPDRTTSLAMFRANKLDDHGYTTYIDRTDEESVRKSNPDTVFVDWYIVRVYLMFLRTDKAPFDDVRVRRALSMAIDRPAWIDSMWFGKGNVDNGPIPYAFTDWKLPTEEAGEGMKYETYNPEEAKKLLAEAGYPDGFKTEILFTQGYGRIFGLYAELIKDFWAKIGVEATLDVKEYGAWIKSGYAGKYDQCAWGLTPAIIDPDEYLYLWYHSGETRNASHVNDPELDKMLEAQRRELDLAKRKQIIYDIQKYIKTQQYYIYGPINELVSVYKPWVKNFKPRTGYDQGRLYEIVWLAPH